MTRGNLNALATLALVFAFPGSVRAGTEAEDTVDPASLLGFEARRLDGATEALDRYRGQVLLVVNTASRCGYTGQYEALQELYDRYRGQGFSVLGFPSNDFGGQEPGSDRQIGAFCRSNYGVEFPMFSKVRVKGADAHPVYAYLTSLPEPVGGPVQWNFQKYLVDRDGAVVARFEPRVGPEDPGLVGEIERLLDEPRPGPAEGRADAVTSGRIAVVGAGIAGLTAAHRLARENLEVVVFEKARGVGGRTSTRRRETQAFDHGAQYFTCRTHDFARQLDDWCGRGVAAAWDAPVGDLDAGHFAPSRERTHRYVGVPGMSALARDLATGLHVECGRRIERIEGSAGKWELVANDAASLRGFDAVVVSTPAPQAAPLLAAAPRLARLARDVEMQPCHAVMVTFSEPLGVEFGGAFVSRPPLAWVARNASKPGRPGAESWVLHATPEWSTHHLEAPADAVERLLIGALGEALGVELPTARSHAAHRWRFARTAKPLGKPCLWEAAAGLGVCGDWTHGSRVEDAFTSGNLLARAMSGQWARPESHAGSKEGAAR